MNTVDTQYQGFLRKLIMYGTEKDDRTGTGTLSYFGDTFRHNMADGFPLLTTKKMAVKSMVTELKWFLRGDSHIGYLLENGCNIWNGDAYKKYCRVVDWDLDEPLSKEEFIDKVKNDKAYWHYGLLGPLYGTQWRKWGGKTYIDQIKELIQNLKNDIHNLELQLELSFELTEQEINNIRENIDEKNQLILKYILQ